ncbi:MAG TPA: hypothetical protein VGK32_17795 [Vicinamibacterales bacterium]
MEAGIDRKLAPVQFSSAHPGSAVDSLIVSVHTKSLALPAGQVLCHGWLMPRAGPYAPV